MGLEATRIGTDGPVFPAAFASRKQAVNIPVLLTGGVQTGADAECLLEEGKADLIGVGRALLKNSAWAKDAITAVQTM